MKQLLPLLALASLTMLPLSPLSAQPLERDLEITLREAVLQDLVDALTPIQGREEIGGGALSEPLEWTLTRIEVQVKPEIVLLTGDVRLDLGDWSYETGAKGRALVHVDPVSKQLRLTIRRFSFDAVIQVLGMEVQLENVNLAELLQSEIVLFDPAAIRQPMEVQVSEEETRYLLPEVEGYDVAQMEGVVILTLDLGFERLSPERLKAIMKGRARSGG
jgi:hypothetical protein